MVNPLPLELTDARQLMDCEACRGCVLEAYVSAGGQANRLWQICLEFESEISTCLQTN